MKKRLKRIEEKLDLLIEMQESSNLSFKTTDSIPGGGIKKPIPPKTP